MAAATDEIMTFSEFKNLSKDEQKSLMLNWREQFKTRDIRSALEVNTATFYKILRELGVSTRERNSRELPKPKATELYDLPHKDAVISEVLPRQETVEMAASDQGVQSNLVQIDTAGVRVDFQGVFRGDKLATKLAGIARLLEDENAEYRVYFHVEAKQ